ncbi:MAG: hypothetical protein ABSC55_21820, partial [Syntrophorhabdales bacterium]
KEGHFWQRGETTTEQELEPEEALADAPGEQAAVAQHVGEIGEHGAVVLSLDKRCTYVQYDPRRAARRAGKSIDFFLDAGV